VRETEERGSPNQLQHMEYKT